MPPDPVKSRPVSKCRQKSNSERAAGILFHITSLPGKYGIGEAGMEAEEFIDFLEKAGQRFWQFLPLGPTTSAFFHSPYMSSSAFAGNPLLISTERLVQDGWITESDLEPVPEFSEYFVIFENVISFKKRILKKAFETFKKGGENPYFGEFCHDASAWLHDYALFESLKRKFEYLPWGRWPDDIASRKPDALRVAERQLHEDVLYFKFEQFLFDTHWKEIRAKARDAGVRLIGDLPIYVAADSADVWANQECFQLDPVTHEPLFVAGVPPDYFSETGQLWGNPLYRWKKGGGRLNDAVYSWWKQRFLRTASLVDVVRIDHFRGFESYWRVPAGEKTAVNGKWVKGPGKAFFSRMGDAVACIDIIAEDLGIITPEVEALRDSLGFPGMKILQFAFDSGPANPYLPWNFRSPNCVCYTGTHDNDTTVGWFLDPEVSEQSKRAALRYANSDGSNIHLDFIRMAYSSTARLAIIPMQDALGFGNDCRMNTPGTTENNWVWRCAPRFITDDLAGMLRGEAEFYARIPETGPGDGQDKTSAVEETVVQEKV